MSPLEQAVDAIRCDDPEHLLEALSLVDVRGRDGVSLVQKALQLGCPRALELLLERGAPLEPEDRLSAAIVCGELERVRALLRTTELDRVDRLGNTPLMVATRARVIEIIELLLSHGADPEVRERSGGNILETAAEAADPRVVELLIRGGADVHCENDSGETPLLRMLWPGIEQISPSRLESVRHLIRAGARLEYRTRISVRRYPGMVDRCSLCNVAGAYFEFSAGHASALELLLATGGPDLLSERGGPALRSAIVHGNLPAVERLLQAGVSPDHPGTDRRPPILLAVRFGQTEVLAKLLQHGAVVPSIEDGDRALLLEARHASDPRLAELLAPYDALYDYPLSPTGLRDAVEAGDLEAVNRLLDAGVDVNTELPGTGGTTIVSLAARRGYAAILRALAARGADVDRASGWGAPLEHAVENGDTECVRALIEVGCDVNAEPRSTGLWHAAQTCHLDIVRLLLAAGADPYIDTSGRTLEALGPGGPHCAATMDVLLSAMHDPVRRRSTLKRALRRALYDQSHDEVRYYLERAPDLYDEPDDDVGESPLKCAAIRGDAVMLRYLLSLGPCAIEGGKDKILDSSPLASAVLKGKLDAVRVLVEAGANVSSRARFGYTPLMYACYLGDREHPAIIDFLLEHGADIDARAADGQTALLLAVNSGLCSVVEALLRRSPDLFARDQKGRTVFDLAQSRGDRRLIELLRLV